MTTKRLRGFDLRQIDGWFGLVTATLQVGFGVSPLARLSIDASSWAQPAGRSFQQHVTTTPHVQNVQVASIERQAGARQTIHRVILDWD